MQTSEKAQARPTGRVTLLSTIMAAQALGNQDVVNILNKNLQQEVTAKHVETWLAETDGKCIPKPLLVILADPLSILNHYNLTPEQGAALCNMSLTLFEACCNAGELPDKAMLALLRYQPETH